MSLGGPAGDITYLAAAFHPTPSGAIEKGETAPVSVPEPPTAMLAGLGLLAMGAKGVRRLRRRRGKPTGGARHRALATT